MRATLKGAALSLGLCLTVAPSAVADTQSFTTSGCSTWTVPNGVSSVEVSAVGAAGADGAPGSGTASAGGAGDGVMASVAVTHGQLLDVCVDVGGAVGGTSGGTGAGAGGDGGGGSGVAMGSDFSNPLLVAGGGGGGGGYAAGCGANGAGGAGGGPGVTGSSGLGCGGGSGGGGGTSAGPGSGGAGGSVNGGVGSPGVPSAGGQGGSGGSAAVPAAGGGGGGGGYYGGGGGGGGFSAASGGSGGGGGGGGSDFCPNTSPVSGCHISPGAGTQAVAGGASGDAEVTLTYTVAAPPSLAITVPTGGGIYARGQMVASSFTCTDGSGGPGIASCVDQNGLPSGSPIDTSAQGPHTLAVTATSRDGLTTSTTVSYLVDGSPPSISIAAPTDGATYTEGQPVDVTYSCSDPDGPGDVASCTGPVASGSSLAASIVGPHSFTVTALDRAGNSASQTVHYTVVAAVPRPSLSGPISTQSQGGATLVIPGISETCPAGGSACVAVLTAAVPAASAARAKPKQLVIGRATFTIAPGKTQKLTFKLNRAGARLLGRLGKLKTSVTVVSRAGGGSPITTTKTITIRRPASKRHRP